MHNQNTRRLQIPALRHPGFIAFVVLNSLSMMADNVEHVITYWAGFQQFQSATLGGFAVISHWLPFLLLSIPSGLLADHFDPRRLIQIGMLMFMACSLGWAYCLYTHTLTMPIAVILLIVHGLSGVLWSPSQQVLLNDIVGKADIQSAVRLNASGRYLGMLVGPALGSVLILYVTPTGGLILNALLYLPLIIWLMRAPFGAFARKTPPTVPVQRLHGVREVVDTLRYVASQPELRTMVALSGLAACCVGTAYQAQMPKFAQDLGQAHAGITYAMLLGADACGALVAGIALETIAKIKTDAINALWLALLWCGALLSFALTRQYYVAVMCLLLAGFCELAFNSMALALIQVKAPAELRGKVIGVALMANSGLRMFPGISVGLFGQLIGVQYALALSVTLVALGLLPLRLFALGASTATAGAKR
jgi:MFS family permease